MRKPLLHTPWFQRSATTAVWALVAASAAFWTLSLPDPDHRAVPSVASSALVADTLGLGALLGSQTVAAQPSRAAASPAQTQYVLVGVLAGTQSRQGAALIAIDGQSPRTYRVGATVGDEKLVLQSVQGRKALLGDSLQGPVVHTLDLPEFKPEAAAASAQQPAVVARPPSPASSARR